MLSGLISKLTAKLCITPSAGTDFYQLDQV